MKYQNADGAEVEALKIVTADDIREVRKFEEWHDGQIAVLTFPTADPILFVGLVPPLLHFGKALTPGQYLVKKLFGGEILPVDADVFEAEYSAVAA